MHEATKHIYAQLDKNNYCCGLSSLSGECTTNNMVRLETYDMAYLGRKYDKENQVWLDEYLPEPEPVQTVTLEDVRKDIHPISKTTQMTVEDALTIIEYLMMLEGKIDALSVK